MTEPIDQATKDLIKKEAQTAADFEYDLDYPDEIHYVKGYIRAATAWAEKLNQERNKAIDALEKHHESIEKGDEYSKGVANCINILYSLFKDKSHE